MSAACSASSSASTASRHGPDWRGPVADRLLISSADGGNAINDAVRTSYRLAALGHRLAGGPPPSAPKDGAQFHFSLPGSVQGFRAERGHGLVERMDVENRVVPGGRALALAFRGVGPGQIAAATTPTFTPPEVLTMRTYELMATPLVYPGQRLAAALSAEAGNTAPVEVAFRLKVYGADDRLRTVDGPSIRLDPGADGKLDWLLPDFGGQPIAEIGFAIATTAARADGAVLVDRLAWSGTPELHLRRPEEASDFWRLAWVNGASFFSEALPAVVPHLAGSRRGHHHPRHARLDRLQGLGRRDDPSRQRGRRRGARAGAAPLLRRYPDARRAAQDRAPARRGRTVLAEMPFSWELETAYDLAVEVDGPMIRARIAGSELTAEDASAEGFRDGGIGLLVHEGALSSNSVRVGPLA